MIKIGQKIEANLTKLVDSKLLIQANSGGGKSWCIRRILEQTYGKVQQIILDPEGEFATLREKYPDYVLCGKDQDAPAEPRSAALLAKRLLENGVSAIIDLYELHPQERKRFVRLFLEAMINAPKDLWHPVLVVIDEAHTFAPEKGESEALSAVIGLASLGRKRGFGAILATQRISKLHKDAAAECNNKLIGRTGLDIDRKRAAEEIGFTAKDDILSLRTLEPGEFYAFGPAISSEVVRGRVGEVETSHPKAGSRIMTKVAPPTDKVKKILAKLADLPQEAKKEAETIQSLKQEISTLKRSNTTAKSSQVDIDRAVQLAVSQEARKWQSEIKAKDRLISGYVDIFSKIKKIIPEEKPTLKKSEPKTLYIYPSPINKTHKPEISDPTESKPLRAGAMKILNWLASVGGPLSKQRVATLSGFAVTGGTFGTYISELKRNGWITGEDQFSITDEGMKNATPIDMPSGEELLQLWRGKFREGAGRILDVVYENHPGSVTKEWIGNATGFEPSGGTFNTYLSELKRNGLIVIEGEEVRISEEFFS